MDTLTTPQHISLNLDPVHAAAKPGAGAAWAHRQRRASDAVMQGYVRSLSMQAHADAARRSLPANATPAAPVASIVAPSAARPAWRVPRTSRATWRPTSILVGA
jgi:hypothetical protein